MRNRQTNRKKDEDRLNDRMKWAQKFELIRQKDRKSVKTARWTFNHYPRG
jgi:hypothetical protein